MWRKPKQPENGDKHMKKIHKYVGLDVHQDTTVIAVAEGGREGEVRVYGQISSDLHALERALSKLGGEDVSFARGLRGGTDRLCSVSPVAAAKD